MQYRELKRHNISAIISVIALLVADILAFYLAYCVTEYSVGDYAGIKYPIRILIMIIVLVYIIKRYNPAPTISRPHEAKILIQLLSTKLHQLFCKQLFSFNNKQSIEKFSTIKISLDSPDIFSILKTGSSPINGFDCSSQELLSNSMYNNINIL